MKKMSNTSFCLSENNSVWFLVVCRCPTWNQWLLCMNGQLQRMFIRVQARYLLHPVSGF